jgi:hypothetical protein
MERKTNKCEALQSFWKQILHQKRKWKNGKFESRVDKGVLAGYSSTRKAYKCYNMRLNKFVERINVTIDETGRPESKEEENESMEQIFEEEAEDEKEVEEDDEENLTEAEEQVHQVTPKTPSRRVQKNHPSD